MTRADASAIVAALAAFVGARAGSWLGGGSALDLAIVAAVCGVGALALGSGPVRLALVATAIVLLGATLSARALDGLEHHELAICEGRAATSVLGIVRSEPVSRRWEARFRMHVHRATCDAASGWLEVERLVLVTVDGDDLSRGRVLEVGDEVELRARVGSLAGWSRRARWDHVVAELRDVQLIDVRPPSGLYATANAVRRTLARGASHLDAVGAALASGFLLGDSRSLPTEIVDEFRASGLSHLLVVSGSNVAFVLALGAPVLRRLPIAGRVAGGLVLVGAFALLTRFEASVLRAAAMATLAMLAVLVGRRASAPRLLALAVTALLLIDPFLAHSLAFGLSVCATAGIALGAGPLRRRIPGPQAIALALAVTIAAQLGVLPLLLVSFGTVPLVAPLTNLVAAPVAEPITVLGLPLVLGAGLCSTVAPPVADLLVAPLGWLLDWVHLVAALGARAPLQLDTAGVLSIASTVATVSLLAALGRPRRRRR